MVASTLRFVTRMTRVPHTRACLLRLCPRAAPEATRRRCKRETRDASSARMTCESPRRGSLDLRPRARASRQVRQHAEPQPSHSSWAAGRFPGTSVELRAEACNAMQRPRRVERSIAPRFTSSSLSCSGAARFDAEPLLGEEGGEELRPPPQSAPAALFAAILIAVISAGPGVRIAVVLAAFAVAGPRPAQQLQRRRALPRMAPALVPYHHAHGAGDECSEARRPGTGSCSGSTSPSASCSNR